MNELVKLLIAICLAPAVSLAASVVGVLAVELTDFLGRKIRRARRRWHSKKKQ